jgi:lambda family phage portal protein
MSGQMPRLIRPDGSAITRADVNAVRVRAAIETPQRSGWPYDAADLYGNEVGGWVPFLQSPDSEINYQTDIMRARSRDIIRNNGWATGSITRIADGMVGSNFHVVPMPNWRVLARAYGPAFDATWAAEFRSEVIAEWRMWAEDPLFYCDAQKSMSVTQMFYLAARHKLADGDSIIMPLWMDERVGFGAARYNTALQLIDPDRLSNPNQAPDTHDMRGGVEVDDAQAPVAYHIRRAHQNDYYDASMSVIWDRFERSTPWGRPLVIHDCDRDRAAQHRGVGILTPVLTRFKMLAKYDQVALQAAVMRTLVGFFIKSPLDPEQVRMAMDLGNGDKEMMLSGYESMRNSLSDRRNLMMNGVHMPVMGPGEDLVKADMGGEADDFDTFEHTFLRSIAAATGESAEEISKDYSKINYSSARAAMLSVWRRMLKRRSDFTAGTASPVYNCFLEEVMDRPGLISSLPHGVGVSDFIALRAAWARCEWIGPGRGWIDPVKERQGEVLGLDAGFGTLRDTCADISGRWWQDVSDERAVEEKYMKANGQTLPDWASADPVPASLIDEKPQPQ